MSILDNHDENSKAPSLNLRQKLIVLLLDLAVLAELCLGMVQAAHSPTNFTPAFMKTFFALAVPTLVLGLAAIRLLRTRNAQSPA